ncbi:MAG: type 2 lanthipeptide synthetase LanM family protein [Pseudomonadota bacterium]
MPLLLQHSFATARLILALARSSQPKSDDCQLQLTVNSDSHARLLGEFPVLAQQLRDACRSWQNNTLNVLACWQRDRSRIATDICANETLGSIVGLVPIQGDRHNGGQQTLILELSCGRCVCFKPRSTELEAKFYEFAKSLGFDEIHCPKFVHGDGYGWMEYVPSQPVSSGSGVARYYYRSGLLLSLLYALEAEDVHAENVVAFGDHPVIVDLETLFHHRDDSVKTPGSATSGLCLGNHTILKSHFVPQWSDASRSGETAALVCVSQRNPSMEHSLPKLNGAAVTADDYVPEITHGFCVGYRRLLRRQALLVCDVSPLDVFSGCSARYICRDTRIYGRLLDAAMHPSYQRDPKNQHQLFSKLGIDASNRPFLRTLVQAEMDALSRSDIPRFTHDVGSTDLSADGQIVCRRYFSISGIDLCKRKIDSLSEEDLQGQIRLLRISLNLSNPQPSHVAAVGTVARFGALPSACMSASTDIGEYLWDEAIPHRGGLIWPVFAADHSGRLCLDPSTASLYGGDLGIALFLAHLDALQPESAVDRDQLIATVKSRVFDALAQYRDSLGCGGFEGIGSLLYVLSRLRTLWPEQTWLKDCSSAVLARLACYPERKKYFDVMSGDAGAILALVSYFHTSNDEVAIPIARQFGLRLLPYLPRWIDLLDTPSVDSIPTGFAHGIAGVAHALIKLHQIDPQPKFIEAALGMMQVESAMYCTERSCWPERRAARIGEHRVRAMAAWCNGSVGIGLSRLSAIELLGGSVPGFITQDLKRAVGHALRRGVSKRHGLCHGNAGLLDFLLHARRSDLLSGSDTKTIDSMTEELVARLQRAQLPENSCSLMNGWTGIGYQLLRVARPAAVPSVLTLDAGAINSNCYGFRSVAVVETEKTGHVSKEEVLNEQRQEL